jgi:hypothetical protein
MFKNKKVKDLKIGRTKLKPPFREPPNKFYNVKIAIKGFLKEKSNNNSCN